MRPLQNKYSDTPDCWQLKSTQLKFGRVPVLMGILNVTPDSFSDGGNFLEKNAAVDQAMQLVDAGAGIIDVGGESTRPYSKPVSEPEELKRTVDIVETIASNTPVPVSIDTSKAKVASECLAAGAEIINDITGLEGDPKMAEVAIEFGAGVCAMHMQGTPQTMQDQPAYKNVVEEIFEYLKGRKTFLLDQGLDPDRICLDPGIGFGKTHQHNLELVSNCGRFHDLNSPVLVGHSRKGFLARVLDNQQCDRAAATAGVAIELARQAIQVIRVHDPGVVGQAIALFDAVGGIDGTTANLDETRFPRA
ncbi:MAG: dihydropteroate synthase [Planctomycetota bacterium]|nr:dihydropteroate synthase [Planctomycetota bacterium]